MEAISERQRIGQIERKCLCCTEAHTRRWFRRHDFASYIFEFSFAQFFFFSAQTLSCIGAVLGLTAPVEKNENNLELFETSFSE